ncbi:MAG TPA: PsbP-related protein [Patescibacteria group bacterium]|nr:PsbP-related protein [Patescibacteria group bacterium]
MDPQTPNFNETVPTPPSPAPESSKKDPHGITIAAMALFVLLSLGAVVFLYNQNQKLKNLVAGYQAPSPTPAQTPDPTASWKTYTNKEENFSFKYPSEWAIDTKEEDGDERKENVFVQLTKQAATIDFYADMMGIGGIGREFAGTPVEVSGYNLYKFQFENTTNDTTIIGVTDALTNSIGVFEIQDKTYSITLRYPNNYAEKAELEREFDLILSTFKLNPTGTPSASPVACTLEAKICPDGTAVGRSGPNCEFAPCP